MVRNVFMFAVVLILGNLPVALAGEPADRDLIPEGRAVLKYLESVYGKRVLVAQNNPKNLELVCKAAGKEPAIIGIDLSGWESQPWGAAYNKVVQRAVDSAQQRWQKGHIITMQCHWIHPVNPKGSAWLKAQGRKEATPPLDFALALKFGTSQHEQVMRDLKGHADYLQQLADAHVPILWRPLHEIDGGWFWWTDHEHPENTAALWRLMFDYFVQQRKLHNLIWVYAAGEHIYAGGKDTAHIEVRKRFYPGANYVDIAGIDIYPSPTWYGWGEPWDDAYPKAFDIMREVAPGKMLALCECKAIPSPDKMAAEGPKWLYCLPWFGEGKGHPAEWIKRTYNHPLMITREQLPDFNVPRP